MRTHRSVVYDAIDSERDYQDRLADTSNGIYGTSFGTHEIPAYLLFMQHYLDLAKARSSMDWSGECHPETLKIIRKIVALGVACMEEHGAFPREPTSNTEITYRVSSEGIPR